MLVVPAVFYGIQRTIEAPERNASSVREEKKLTLLTELVARAGSKDAAEELIRLRAESLFAASGHDAQQFAQELIEQLPKRAENYKALQTSSSEAADRVRLDWEPLSRLVVREFESRVVELERRGIKVRLSRFELPLILLGRTSRSFDVVRRAEFSEGLYRLELYQDSGEIDLGRVTRPGGYVVFGLTPNHGGKRQFLGVSLDEKTVDWNFPPDLSDHLERGTEAFNTEPAAAKFRKALRKALNNAFEFAVVSVSDQKSSSN
jgi:hypothetical protein